MEAFLKTFDLTLMDGKMILVCAVLFFVFWKLFDRMVFRPFLNLLEQREGLTSGALTSAQETIARARELTDQYEQRLFEARSAEMKEKLSELSKAKADGAKVISSAEDQAQEEVRKQRWDAQQNMQSLRQNVLKDADALASVIVEKVKQPGQGASR